MKSSACLPSHSFHINGNLSQAEKIQLNLLGILLLPIYFLDVSKAEGFFKKHQHTLLFNRVEMSIFHLKDKTKTSLYHSIKEPQIQIHSQVIQLQLACTFSWCFIKKMYNPVNSTLTVRY